MKKSERKNRWKNTFVICLVLLSMFMTSIAVNPITAEAVEANAVNDARYAVVRILVISDSGSGLGTGFGIGTGDGYADTFLTNWHVVTLVGTVDYQDADIYILLDDNTEYTYEYDPDDDDEYDLDDDYRMTSGTLGNVVKCEVLYAEEEYPDVAVIQTEEPIEGVEKLPLRRATQSLVGQIVYTIGYPGSADDSSLEFSDDYYTYTKKIKASVSAVSVATGTVSRCLAMERFGNTYCIEHDAHINHGNSGGPLILADGSVVGINTYGYGDSSTNEYSDSIYIDYAIDVLDELGIAYTLADDDADTTTTAQGGDDPGTTDSDGISTAAIVGIVVAVLVAAAVAAVLVLRGKKKPNSSGASGNITGQGAAEAGATAPVNMGQPAGGGAPAAGAEEYRIQGVGGTYAGRRFRPEGEIYFGRNPGRCRIVFPEGTAGVSGCHCVIKLSDGKLLVADMGSTYGTYVNGVKLAPNQYRQLSVGDEICIGSDREKFRITRQGGAV